MKKYRSNIWLLLLTFTLVAATEQTVFSQATVNSVFVANNGNLEGSVTAFTFDGNGVLSFVNRIVTGTRISLSDPCAGCNAYEISLTPNGKYLATCHPAGDLDGITILEVHPNALISQIVQVPLVSGMGTPIDLVWIDDQYLAVIRTDTSPDKIITYLLNPSIPSLTEVSSFTLSGNSTGYIARHPSGQYIYANDSSLKIIYAFSVGAGGVLSLIDSESSGTPFPLEIRLNPAGTRLYAAGGISNGGHSVVGMDIAGDGTLTVMPGSPFTSPGSSPSNVYVNPDGTKLMVGHGTDATAWSFSIDQTSGAITSTAHSFDVGLQGTLGDVHCGGNIVFISDNSTATDGVMGVYSFTLKPDGDMVSNGPIVSTQGIAPRGIVSWIAFDPDGDMNCDLVVNLLDVDPFVLGLLDPDGYAQAFPSCDILHGDVNDDGFFDGADVGSFSDKLLGLEP